MLQETLRMTQPHEGVIEMLIDVIYSDVVKHDSCCRRVGSAFIVSNELALRELVTSGNLPCEVEKAIETYCIRNLLQKFPTLILSSANVADALLRIADQLRVEPRITLVAAGEQIYSDVVALRERLTTNRYAHLIEMLGEAAAGYLLQASRFYSVGQKNDEAGEEGSKISVMRAVQSFASAVKELEAAKEKELNNVADRLLFSSTPPPTTSPPASTAGAGETEAKVPRTQENNISFSQSIRDAMHTPQKLPPPTLNSDQKSENKEKAVGTRTPKPPASSQAKMEKLSGRMINNVVDAVAEGCAALEREETRAEAPTQARSSQQNGGDDVKVAPHSLQDISSIVVEASIVSSSPASTKKVGGGRRKGPVLVGATDASVLMAVDVGNAVESPPSAASTQSTGMIVVETPTPGEERDADGKNEKGKKRARSAVTAQSEDAWLSRRDVESRSYFLCDATHRFEPMAAKGFF